MKKMNSTNTHRIVTRVSEIPPGYVRMGRLQRQISASINWMCRAGEVDSIKIMGDELDHKGPVYVNMDDVARCMRQRKKNRRAHVRRHREAISLSEAFDRLKPRMRLKFKVAVANNGTAKSKEYCLK